MLLKESQGTFRPCSVASGTDAKSKPSHVNHASRAAGLPHRALALDTHLGNPLACNFSLVAFATILLDMPLPFRLKAGGSRRNDTMAPISTSVHHHRSTTKIDHKPFKSRFASKSALKDKAKGADGLLSPLRHLLILQI